MKLFKSVIKKKLIETNGKDLIDSEYKIIEVGSGYSQK